MNVLELADKWDAQGFSEYELERECGNQMANMLRQQQAEIDRLNYDLDGFKQNFFVSGFHLQIKMANEQLVKQQEQIDALKSVVYWLKENRPEVWEDIQKWRKI